MDPVTHITSGAIVVRAIKSKFPHRGIFTLCIISAVIPDIDNLSGLLNPEMYLLHHRGVTHSLLGGLLIALLLALAFRLFSTGLNIKKAFLISYSLVLVHIYLDLITSFGTQILYPFSNARYAISCVFIIDPFFTSIMLFFLIFSYIIKNRSKSLAIAALFFIVIYPVFSFSMKTYTKKLVNQKLVDENIRHDRVILEPDLFSPFNWKIIVEDDDHYMLSGINLFDLKRTFHFDIYQKADVGRMVRLSEKAGIFRTFGWFSAYPVMEIEKQNNIERIYFGDLRFYSSVPFVKKYRSNNESIPFSLFANLDENRNLVSWEYNRPGKQKFIEFVE